MEYRAPLFDRLFVEPGRVWLALGGAIVFGLVPLAAALLAGSGPEAQAGDWWDRLVAPVMIVYVLAVGPSVEHGWLKVYNSLRPAVLLADQEYADLVTAAAAVPQRNEVLAFVLGGLLGLLRVGPSVSAPPSWMDAYLLLSTAVLFGLLLWVTYLTVARTRATAKLLKQPVSVDPNEISPFLGIGEQGLVLALVFIGGATLSLLFSAFEPNIFLDPGFWAIYTPIALVPVAVFFFAMWPTHRVLAAAKAQQLKTVRDQLRRASQRLVEQLAHDVDPGELPVQINALATLEQRLQNARTWPYNTTMLRTLFVSVMTPAALLLIRKLLERF